jgi:hypothetical protein
VTAAVAAAGGGPVPGRPRGRRDLIRAVLAIVLAVLVGVAAVLLARRGVRTDVFPPFLQGETGTTITRYSGPWLTAAAGAALLATLLLLLAAIDLVRWSRSARPSRAAA